MGNCNCIDNINLGNLTLGIFTLVNITPGNTTIDRGSGHPHFGTKVANAQTGSYLTLTYCIQAVKSVPGKICIFAVN